MTTTLKQENKHFPFRQNLPLLKSQTKITCSRTNKMQITDVHVLFQFIGRWYEVERSFYIMELTSTCMDIDLTANARGQIEVEVNTRSIWYEMLNIQCWGFNLCVCVKVLQL